MTLPPEDVHHVPPGQLLLTVRQAAVLIGASRSATWHRIYRGQLPGVVRIGGSVYFRRPVLLRFLQEGRGPSPTRSRR